LPSTEARRVRRASASTVERDQLLELCGELLAARQLLERLGTDLRAVAAHAGAARLAVAGDCIALADMVPPRGIGTLVRS
jgi:hypothetical protein